MAYTMIMNVNGADYEIDVYDNAVAVELFHNLPQAISMSRWGDEFYGTLSCGLGKSSVPLRDVFEVGEVALWPDGNAFCLFFGPTPVSLRDEPRMASPGVPLGKMRGDATVFRQMGSSLKVKLDKA